MFTMMVHVLVKVGDEAAFEAASLENAKNSIKEPGIVRFDVLRNEGEPSKFLLVEVFRDAKAPADHRDTEHYKKWRETVEPMMAQPRQGIKYNIVESSE